MVLLLGGEKGGSGKTTLAVNLAAIRTKEAGSVLLVDTDRQPTSSYWCLVREESNVTPRVASIQKFDKAVKTEVQALKSRYDDIIIDAGGRDSPELRASLLVANKAIFPLRPSQFDLWTLGKLNDLLDDVKDLNPNLSAFVVLNQVSPNPASRDTEMAKGLIGGFANLQLLKTLISSRISFCRAVINGMAVTEYKPEDPKATEEIVSFYKEIFNHEPQ